MSERNYSTRDVVVRQALQYAEVVRKVTGCHPLVQLAVSPDVFGALAVELGHTPEPGESEEIRISGGIKVATFDAVSLREGWTDMLAGTKTLARASDERDQLRAALAEALEQWRVWISPHASTDLIAREEARIAELRKLVGR